MTDLGSRVKPMIAELLGIRWWLELLGMEAANQSNESNRRGQCDHCGLEGRTAMWLSLRRMSAKFVNLLPSFLPTALWVGCPNNKASLSCQCPLLPYTSQVYTVTSFCRSLVSARYSASPRAYQKR